MRKAGILILFLFFINCAYAIGEGQVMFVSLIDNDKEPYFDINYILVTPDNLIYNFFRVRETEEATQNMPDTIYYEDEEGNVLSVGGGFYDDLVNYSPNIAKIRFTKDGKDILDYPISFCDNDGMCEPCSEENCHSAENSYTCDDCPTGGSDNFCDAIEEGRCDQDCPWTDADCKECEECIYFQEDIADRCVSEYDGVFCVGQEACTGTGVYGFGETHCCIGGECKIPEAVVITLDDMDLVRDKEGNLLNKTLVDKIITGEIDREDVTDEQLILVPVGGLDVEQAGEETNITQPITKPFPEQEPVQYSPIAYIIPALVMILLIVIMSSIIYISKKRK